MKPVGFGGVNGISCLDKLQLLINKQLIGTVSQHTTNVLRCSLDGLVKACKFYHVVFKARIKLEPTVGRHFDRCILNRIQIVIALNVCPYIAGVERALVSSDGNFTGCVLISNRTVLALLVSLHLFAVVLQCCHLQANITLSTFVLFLVRLARLYLIVGFVKFLKF